MGPHAVISCLLFTLLLAEATTVSASKEDVKISVTPIFPRIPRDQTRNHFQVLVSVKAPTEGMAHPNTALVLVSSITNSMWKEWAENATRSLRRREGEDHSLHVVEPPNTKHTDKQPLKDLLNNATKALDDEKKNGFILLLTDGDEHHVTDDHTDDPVKEIEDLVQNGDYTVHTLGLGVNHDHHALSRISSASTGGTYSFIENLTSSDDIYAALAVSLGGFKDVVAHKAVVELEHKEGVLIEDIDTGNYKSSEMPDKTTIEIGMLQAGETKNFIVHLTVEPQPHGGGANCSSQVLLTATLRRDGALPKHAAACVERPQDFDLLRNAPNPLVMQNIVRLELLKKIHHLDKSKFVGRNKREAVAFLDRTWEEFEQDHRLWSGMDVLLGGFEYEINAMKKHIDKLSRQARMAYIYSWISSYRTQRPAALGSLDNVVVEFHTEEVKFMVKTSYKKHIRPSECTEPKPCLQISRDQDEALKKAAKLETEVIGLSEALKPIIGLKKCKDDGTTKGDSASLAADS